MSSSTATHIAAPVTRGIHHLGLSVPDVNLCAAFFTGELGFEKVGEKPDYPAVFVSDGSVMLTLWQVKAPDQCNAFDRLNNVGLHHFAMRVDPATLPTLHARLAARDDVEIEFAPEALGATDIRHMMCHIPGGLRIEFIAAE